MTKNHIPAPWTHHAGSGDIYKDGYLIASVRLNSRDIEPEERATAQRIVQCVNALEEFENPSQLVEDYKSMKALLKEMLMIWDRGASLPANCIYPNAVRLQLGLEPKAVERKTQAVLNIKHLVENVVVLNIYDEVEPKLEAQIVQALTEATMKMKGILESS